MKKLTVWLMVLSLGVFTIGCGETTDDADTTTTPDATTPDTPAGDETTPPAGDETTPPADDPVDTDAPAE